MAWEAAFALLVHGYFLSAKIFEALWSASLYVWSTLKSWATEARALMKGSCCGRQCPPQLWEAAAFRDKVKVTPVEEQVCDYCNFCSGKNYYFFSVRESLEATMSPRPVVPTKVSMGTLENSQRLEHLASATHGRGNTPEFSQAAKSYSIWVYLWVLQGTGVCYSRTWCKIVLRAVRYVEKVLWTLWKINFGSSDIEKIPTLYSGSSTIIHLFWDLL